VLSRDNPWGIGIDESAIHTEYALELRRSLEIVTNRTGSARSAGEGVAESEGVADSEGVTAGEVGQ